MRLGEEGMEDIRELVYMSIVQEDDRSNARSQLACSHIWLQGRHLEKYGVYCTGDILLSGDTRGRQDYCLRRHRSEWLLPAPP